MKDYKQYLNSLRFQLVDLRNRYFRPVIKHPDGTLNHHAYCETFRAMDIYKYAPCTCGLLHDLKTLPDTIVSKIYRNYAKDHARQEAMVPGSFYWMDEEEKKESQQRMKALIRERFGDIPDQAVDKEDEDMEWILIRDVFGNAFRERMQTEWSEKERENT